MKTGQPLYVTDVLCCSARVAWAFAPSAREVTEILFAEIELRNSVIYTSRGSRVEPRLLYTDGTDNNGWQGCQYQVLSQIIF